MGPFLIFVAIDGDIWFKVALEVTRLTEVKLVVKLDVVATDDDDDDDDDDNDDEDLAVCTSSCSNCVSRNATRMYAMATITNR